MTRNCPLCGKPHSNADMLGHIWECEERQRRKKQLEEVQLARERDVPEAVQGTQEEIKHLILKLLLNESKRERIEAAYTLGCYGRRGFRGPTQQRPDRSYRGRLITESDLPIVIDALEQALEDQHRAVRAEAVRALGKIKVTSAVPALEKTLEDFKHEYACERCGSIEAPDSENCTECGLYMEPRFREPYSALPALAAEALGDIGDPSAIQVLLEVARRVSGTYQDPEEWKLRAAAIAALGKLGGSKTSLQGSQGSVSPIKNAMIITSLRFALDDENYAVFLKTIHALGNIGSTRAASLLELLYLSIQDKNWGRRYAWFGKRVRVYGSWRGRDQSEMDRNTRIATEIVEGTIREAIIYALYNSVVDRRVQGYGIPSQHWNPDLGRRVPNMAWEGAAIRVADFLRARYEDPSTSSDLRSKIGAHLIHIDRKIAQWGDMVRRPLND